MTFYIFFSLSGDMLERGEKGTCWRPVEVAVSLFKQCVTLSLSHSLSLTTSQVMLSGEGDLGDAICQCSASNVKGTVEGFVGG